MSGQIRVNTIFFLRASKKMLKRSKKPAHPGKNGASSRSAKKHRAVTPEDLPIRNSRGANFPAMRPPSIPVTVSEVNSSKSNPANLPILCGTMVNSAPLSRINLNVLRYWPPVRTTDTTGLYTVPNFVRNRVSGNSIDTDNVRPGHVHDLNVLAGELQSGEFSFKRTVSSARCQNPLALHRDKFSTVPLLKFQRNRQAFHR